MSELIMDERIVWDSMSLKQIDEAKSQIMKRKAEGYLIVMSNGKPMIRFNPRLEEVIVKAEKVNKKVLMILNEKGDERIVWDKEDGFEAKEAKAKFEEFMKKGYKAYSVDHRGKKKTRIEEFDVDSEEILMVAPTVRG